jgi:hypothetical protein
MQFRARVTAIVELAQKPKGPVEVGRQSTANLEEREGGRVRHLRCFEPNRPVVFCLKEKSHRCEESKFIAKIQATRAHIIVGGPYSSRRTRILHLLLQETLEAQRGSDPSSRSSDLMSS